MSGWLILALVVLVLIALAVGGAIAQRRRMEATSGGFAARLEHANEDLAAAHANDKGWDPDVLADAARSALQERHPGSTVEELTLIQVVDRPGIQDDEAHYRARVGGREAMVTMLRHDGDWIAQPIDG